MAGHTLIWVLAAILQCSFLALATDTSLCPELSLTYKWSRLDNTCFQFYYGSKTWREAQSYCIQNAGRLAMLSDQRRFNHVKGELNRLPWRTDTLWIGLNDMNAELEWKWTNNYREDEVPLTWSNWGGGHPEAFLHTHKDCVAMEKDGGSWTWHEYLCNVIPWTYKFICEYEIEDPNTAHDNSGLVNVPITTTTTTTLATPELTIRHGTNHPHQTRGNNRKVTLQDDINLIDPEEIPPQAYPEVLESKEDESSAGTHVPMYALVLSFGCGFLLAMAIVIFLVVRRRRRKKSAHSPHVVYHAAPECGNNEDNLGMGAVGGTPAVCLVSGKTCKIAVNTGQTCRCDAQDTADVDSHQPPSRPRLAADNLYVDGAMGVTRVDSPLDSLCSLGTPSMEEAPPTYDEVCAGILSEKIQKTGANACTNSETQTIPGKGAIPKTPKKTLQPISHLEAVEGYVPMNGSQSSLDSTPRNSGIDDGAPRSLGELPPIPTDEGYEIPVSLPPTLRISSSASRPSERGVSQVSNVDSDATEYSEIAERSSKLFKDDEEIYSTID